MNSSPWQPAGWLAGFARGEFYAVLLVLGFGNGLVNRIMSSLDAGLGDAALRLFGVNAVLWFALFVIARIGLEAAPAEPLHRADRFVGLAVLAACLLPVPLLGTLSAIGAAVFLFFTSASNSPLKRMALVAMAVSGPLLWGPIAMRLFAPEVVRLEAGLIGSMTGLPTVDNVFQAADGRSKFVVFSACSSLLNVSLSILLLVTLTQQFGIDLSRRLIPTALLAMAVTVLVNLSRLATIGFYPHLYSYIHEGAGSMMFGLLSLLLMGTVVVVGVSRAARPAY